MPEGCGGGDDDDEDDDEKKEDDMKTIRCPFVVKWGEEDMI